MGAQPAPDVYAETARELGSWDGGADSARRLRERAKALPAVRGQLEGDPERVLQRVRGCYADRRLLSVTTVAAAPALYGPFLGDPDLGAWPFHDPLHIADDEARAWLEVLGAACAVDEPIRRFVDVTFRVRRRAVWVAAAEALALMARRDDGARATLAGHWKRCYPAGLPKAWPQRALWVAPAGMDAPEAKATRHLARHVLAAACRFTAAGGTLDPALDPDRFASLGLPADAASASVVLIAARFLSKGDATRGAARALVERHLAQIPAEATCETALRELADAIPEATSAIEDLLALPRWLEAHRGSGDALWSWLETAKWLRARGKPLGRLRLSAGPAARALDFALGEWMPEVRASPGEALLAPLAAVLDDDVWATTTSARRAAVLAESVLLLEREDVGRLPWGALVSRARGRDAQVNVVDRSRAAEVGLATVVVTLAGRGDPPLALLRDAALSEDATLELARSRDPQVAIQVAVQVERLLRDHKGGAAGAGATREIPGAGSTASGGERTREERQVRLLWRLLQQDPTAKVFLELEDLLRGDGTPLHALVGALRALHQRREEANPSALALANDYGLAARAAADLLGRRGSEPDKLLADLSARLTGAPPSDPLLSQRLARLQQLLFGEGAKTGLVDWLAWLGTPISAELHAEFERFRKAVDAAEAAQRGRPEPEHHAELEDSAKALHARLASLIWPERAAALSAAYGHGALASSLREGMAEAAAVDQEIRKNLDEANEPGLRALVAPAALPRLSRAQPALLRELHGVYLERLLFREASRLANLAGKPPLEELTLPSPAAYVAPVIAAVTGGVFLVLQVGAWNELLVPLKVVPLAVTHAIALFTSFLQLMRLLQVQRHELARVVTRLVLAFAATWLVAATVSALLLWSLDGTSSRMTHGQPIPFVSQWMLWTSLSQFLGLFLGLVVQGRRLQD